MEIIETSLKGLSTDEVIVSREQFGRNQLSFKEVNPLWEAIQGIIKEPMMLLLLTAAMIYFVSGKTADGIFMSAAILLVATISLYQDSRSRKALSQLNELSQPKCKVIRNGITEERLSTELVVGDCLIVEEGISIPADGTILQSNDFSVNESVLTGESFSVFKDTNSTDNKIFRGTNVASGLAIAKITAVGNATQLGQIGQSLESIEEQKTPLEIQIKNFVHKMAIIGALVFLIVWGINYSHSHRIIDSLLQALTLAMSILPEEIPVAFTTFMALGAWRLMKLGIVVKQMKTVEALGSANIICTDKTGTITENKMSLAKLFNMQSKTISSAENDWNAADNQLIRMAMWASEPIPFDPMEMALHQSYAAKVLIDERSNYKIIHEYPLGGKPPMMTHIFENQLGQRIIAAKGAPEALIAHSNLSKEELLEINAAIQTLTAEGFRILGVATTQFEGWNFPKSQQEFKLQFLGIVAFFDPPKANIAEVLQQFHAAGIAVKMVTGDNAATSTTIAQKIGLMNADSHLSGDGLMQLNAEELKKSVMEINIFSRMFPEAKLKIINALISNNQIVAMTGDGVNDGPALKAAHIGIAMGKKGTEIARQSASLILLDDDLAKMVDAVAMGRKIYTNLKKAIQYIISIHIPIILIVFIPLVLRWVYPNIFSPVHVIFLELIMGPTCSIIYENEPMEKNTMLQKPRLYSNTFFNIKELTISIFQGLIITFGCLFIYRYAVAAGSDEAVVRTMVFTTIIIANIFLTLVNRSFYYSIFSTLHYKNTLVFYMILLIIFLLLILIYIPAFSHFFLLSPLNRSNLELSILVGFLSVIWVELVKWIARKQVKKTAIEHKL